MAMDSARAASIWRSSSRALAVAVANACEVSVADGAPRDGETTMRARSGAEMAMRNAGRLIVLVITRACIVYCRLYQGVYQERMISWSQVGRAPMWRARLESHHTLQQEVA